MPISNTDSHAGPYYPDGIVTDFPFGFDLFPTEGVAGLRVARIAADGRSAIIEPGSYSVIPGSQGGTVRFAAAPAPGDPLFILASPSFKQQIAFSNQAPYLPEVVTDALDQAAARDIYMNGLLGRAILMPPGESAGNAPTATDRADKLLGFDETGNVLVSVSHAALIDAAASAAEDRRRAEEAAQQATAAVIGNQPARNVSDEYTITAEDRGFLLFVNSSTTTNIYYPQGLPVGFWCEAVQNGTGAVYILADVDQQVNSLDGQNKIKGRFGRAKIEQAAEDSVILSGDLLGVGSVGWVKSAYVDSQGWYLWLVIDGVRGNGHLADLDEMTITMDVTHEGYTNGVLGIRSETYRVTDQLREPFISLTEEPPKRVDYDNDGNALIPLVLNKQLWRDSRNGGAGTSGVDPVITLPAGWWIDGPRTAPAQTVVVTNNSIEPYPLVNCQWQIPPFMLSDTHVRVEAYGDGEGARNSRTLDCVIFTATGATSGITTAPLLVDAITKSTFRGPKTNPSMGYGADLDVSALTQGEKGWLNFEAYPFIGDEGSVNKTVVRSFPMQSSFDPGQAPPLPFKVDKTGAIAAARVHASWDINTGNDATAIASTNLATAQANPAATFQKAMYLAFTANGNSMQNICIELNSAGDYPLNFLATSPSAPNVIFARDDAEANLGDCWWAVRPRAGVSGINVIRNGGGAALPSQCHLTCNVKATAGGTNMIVIDGQEASTISRHIWFEPPTLTGIGDASNATITGFGWIYLSNITAVNAGRLLAAMGTKNNNIVLARDIDFDMFTGGGQAWCTSGVHVEQLVSAAILRDVPAVNGSYFNDGCVAVNVSAMRSNTESMAFSRARARGGALMNVLLESIQTTQPGAGMYRDGNFAANKNWHVRHVSVYGSRWNINYEDDAGTMAANSWWNGVGQGKKATRLTGCIPWALYTKSDYFAKNPNNVHTWNQRWHVGWRDNTFLTGAYSNPNLGWNNELGELLNDGERLLSLTDPSPLFVDYRATAAGGGGGNYRPVSSELAGLSVQVRPFDLRGGPVDPNLATAARGPLEHA